MTHPCPCSASRLRSRSRLIVPAGASGAVKRGLDRHAGMRLTLDGRVLSAEILSGRHPDLDAQLFGKRIDAICSSSFFHPQREHVIRTRLWPIGARRLSFRFGRDISRAAKWCLIEQDVTDVASVSFIQAEPIRFAGKGRGPYHTWWRLGAGTSLLGEPCVLLRIEGSAVRWCFRMFAERRVTLGVQHWVTCEGNAYFFGVVGPAATAVRVVFEDGSSVAANVYAAPDGSSLRARVFADALPAVSDVRAVRTLDAAGAVLHERRVPEPMGPACP